MVRRLSTRQIERQGSTDEFGILSEAALHAGHYYPLALPEARNQDIFVIEPLIVHLASKRLITFYDSEPSTHFLKSAVR